MVDLNKKKKVKANYDKKTTTITFFLDKNAIAKLTEEAKNQRRTLSNLVQYILMDYVTKVKRGEI
jgi:hypothetical protein